MASSSNAEIKDHRSDLLKISVETTGYVHMDRGTPGSAGAPALIGLHGYGQTARDFLRVLRQLAPPNWTVAAPQGINQLWSGPGKPITFSWLTSYEKQDSIPRNNRFIASVIDAMAADAIVDPAKIFLLGFSQGSSVAYRFAQSHPDKIRGLISAGGDLPPDVEDDMAPLQAIPVLILYGTKDKLVPPEMPRYAHEALRSAQVDATAFAFDRGHVIPSSLAPRVQQWLIQTIEADNPDP